MEIKQLMQSKAFYILGLALIGTLGFLGLFDDLGLGWLNYYIADILQNIIDYVIFIFIIAILFGLFSAPIWVRRLLTWGSD